MFEKIQLLRFLPWVIAAAVGVFAAMTMLPGFGWEQNSTAGEAAVAIPPPERDLPQSEGGGLQTIVLAGGCFWGVQGVYQHVKGVVNAVSGYAGGEADTAHYHQVGSGRTGHAESVQVTFDPARISYGELLQIFFSVVHDPTQLDRQGPDYGSQYRSAIFAANPEQRKVAEAYIAQLDKAGVFSRKIATRVEPLRKFYAAEEYHQNYMTLHPRQPYISAFDLPKVANLKRAFPARYQDDPMLVGEAGSR